MFIGISNDGKPIGVENTDSLQKKIRKASQTDCYPPINIQMKVDKIEGKNILAAIVSPSRNRPHFVGPAYVRIGSESVKASDECFEDLINSRTSKVAHILQWKGKIVTVIACGKLLGKEKRIGPTSRMKHHCKILDCNSQDVRVWDESDSKPRTEPLSNVELSYDEGQNRLKLIVSSR